MTKFKKGDAVWIYYTSKPGDYPGMYQRPGIITKRIHPTSYMVAFAGTKDTGRPVSEWVLDRRSHEHHPSEMLPYSDAQPPEDNECNANDRLEELRAQWKAEAPPEQQAAWWKSEEDRERLNRELNQTLRPILARMMR
jgi:hypothetical protein